MGKATGNFLCCGTGVGMTIKKFCKMSVEVFSPWFVKQFKKDWPEFPLKCLVEFKSKASNHELYSNERFLLLTQIYIM